MTDCKMLNNQLPIPHHYVYTCNNMHIIDMLTLQILSVDILSNIQKCYLLMVNITVCTYS